MKNGVPFAPYQGTEDYIFISYAHRDKDRVFDVIRRLHERKYRIWYDQGIEAGTDWAQTVAEKLLHSALVLVFLSENSLRSQNCRREIGYAVSQRKNMLVLSLDGSELPADMAMQLSVVPRVAWDGGPGTAEALAARLDASLLGDGVTGYEQGPAAGSRGVNRWRIVSAVTAVLLLAAVIYIAAGLGGRLSGAGIVRETLDAPATAESGPVSVTRFQDLISMEILLKSLNSPYVHICGNAIVSDASAIARGSDGWEIGGERVERGPIARLDYFAGREIVQLSLVNESLKSLSGAEALTGLRYLDLSDNPVADLSPLSALTELETVKLLGLSADTDLSPLASLPGLKTVVVSYDMVGGIAPLVDAGIDVIVRR